MIYRYGELFCGAGGLALGAGQAIVGSSGKKNQIVHTWATDIDGDACETFRRNLAPGNPSSVVKAPVEELDLGNLPEIDALGFGFPCNDFSAIGEKNGVEGKFGPLYSYGVLALEIHKPRWFLAENVTGLRSANNGQAFLTILEQLQEAGPGYNIVPHLYKFEQYGIPQTRHRIIIVGIRKDLRKLFKVPAPITPEPFQWLSASRAITEPPIPDTAANQQRTRQSQVVIDRLNHIPPGQNAWYEGIPEELRLNVKTAKLSVIYRRLHPDRPSYTVTGSGGGGTHGYHWSEPRALTNRERARLQTFPDSYTFTGGKESVRRQIGMAVPPEAAKIIVGAILSTFAGIQYESVPPKWQSNGEPITNQMRLE